MATAAERQKAYRERKKLTAALLDHSVGSATRLSEIVQSQVRKAVLAGDLTPTIKDGLTAERIIDQREAKREDHKLDILKLLAGGAGGFLAPVELIEDGRTIDGEATEV